MVVCPFSQKSQKLVCNILKLFVGHSTIKQGGPVELILFHIALRFEKISLTGLVHPVCTESSG